jgi:uncharacterized protein (DUF1810 family)
MEGITLDQRLFYVRMALTALREAEAYLACAGCGHQLHHVHKTTNSVKEARYTMEFRDAGRGQ